MRVGHYHSAHAGGHERAKTEAENTLVLYLQKFHWDWPLSYDPKPDKEVSLDEDLSKAEKEWKGQHVEHLRGVSGWCSNCNRHSHYISP